MVMTAKPIAAIIASEIKATAAQVGAAAELLDAGATVPFIARYRKEVTGGLDDTQLRTLSERLTYLRELEARRASILESIRGQGKLTDELEGKIAATSTKAELEDIYLPYKPKRRTKAEIARERGLGPLAEAILADRSIAPTKRAAAFLSADVPDAKAALDGARDIIAEGMLPRTPISWADCETTCGRRRSSGRRSSTASRNRGQSFPTISITRSAGQRRRATVLWRCCAAGTKKSCRSISSSTRTRHLSKGRSSA
ncbi:hypothetical protein ABIA24_002795 [Sinorhizobium fredii]